MENLVLKPRQAWGSWKFCLSWWLYLCKWRLWELLPLLPCKVISLNTRGQMYNSCVRETMLYSSEYWALIQEDKERVERSERAMLLWMCNIKKERVSKNSLLSRLKLKRLDSVLKCNKQRWFGHVKRSKMYTRQILDLDVEGNKSRGRPKNCCLDAIKDNLRQWNFQPETSQNRSEWRNDWKLTHTHAARVTWR